MNRRARLLGIAALGTLIASLALLAASFLPNPVTRQQFVVTPIVSR